jgi:hypothetical protein
VDVADWSADTTRDIAGSAPEAARSRTPPAQPVAVVLSFSTDGPRTGGASSSMSGSPLSSLVIGSRSRLKRAPTVPAAARSMATRPPGLPGAEASSEALSSAGRSVSGCFVGITGERSTYA